MPLKVELKPGEKIILGESVVTNGDQRSTLLIDGDAPILREKDIFTAETADTPAKRIYLTVQLMYLNGSIKEQQDLYFTLTRQILEAAPSMHPLIDSINNQILTGNLYKALRQAKSLIVYEKRLINDAKSSSSGTGISESGPERRRASGT